MVDYAKPWLPVCGQIDKLIERGVIVADRVRAAKLLRAVGYYRLTGYLYPFRRSERYRDEHDRERTRVLNCYREGTSIEDAARLPGGDWALRVATHLRAFPTNAVLDLGSMGIAPGWLDEELWHI